MHIVMEPKSDSPTDMVDFCQNPSWGGIMQHT